MLRVGLVVSLLMSLMACSSTPGWKGVYSSDNQEKNTSQLEIPPDLSQPLVTDSLALPNIATSSSTYSAYLGGEYKGDKVLPANLKGVKVVRDGNYQWLEIQAPAEKLWVQLRAFFTVVGFEIKRENKELGVMETNWLESEGSATATNWVSKLLKRFTSTGLRDKYRARLEKTNNPNVTRIFITHKG